MKRLCLLAVLAVLAGAGPAWAHEEINPSTVPINKPAFLTLTTANEKQAKLTKVTLDAPPGLAFGATVRDPAGWTSSRTDATITWTGGSVDPDHFESFGYEIEGADQPGTVSYKVTLGYADGSTDDATVQLTATAAAAGTSGSAGSGKRRANAALGVGIVALVAAVAALALAARRPTAGTPQAAGATRPVEQDW